jgi:hypothetical protein
MCEIGRKHSKLVRSGLELMSVVVVYALAAYLQSLKGYHGGGDPYYTDSRLAAGVFVPQQSSTVRSSRRIAHPIPRA